MFVSNQNCQNTCAQSLGVLKYHLHIYCQYQGWYFKPQSSGCMYFERSNGPIVGVYTNYRRIQSKCVLGLESCVTAELMLKFGINNVFLGGGVLCHTELSHGQRGQIDTISGTLL